MSNLEGIIREWNHEEHRFLTLANEADLDAELMSEDDRLHHAAKWATNRRRLRESKERVAAILARLAGDA